jgi:hypothetical protein
MVCSVAPVILNCNERPVAFGQPYKARVGPKNTMFLATKIGWAALALTLVTTAMFVRDFPRSSASANFDQEGPATFVIRDEITKMQEGLRNKGDYRGKIDGVIGLRTRASIREYQKAENLPVTGQVDTQTADGLGV